MAEEDCRVPPLTHFCYQAVNVNLDRFSSFGRLPYRLVKPILQGCDAETLSQIERTYDQWQQVEYLQQTDAEIWRPKCMELLGPNAHSIYASRERQQPDVWRREYFQIIKERKTAVNRATDRISRMREAKESDQRKAKLIPGLAPAKRRSSANPLNLISNPYMRKVVANTQKQSHTSYIGQRNSNIMTPPPRITLPPGRPYNTAYGSSPNVGTATNSSGSPSISSLSPNKQSTKPGFFTPKLRP